ncbi:MAG: hypothetical protein J6T34_01360 [Bacilli bacterium]|nr:hypothetical protein [Bacilli bacterium]
MFRYCSSLVIAPSIAATTLAELCCNCMFAYCAKLIIPPPTLAATTLTVNCYNGMFDGCASLTTAP